MLSQSVISTSRKLHIRLKVNFKAECKNQCELQLSCSGPTFSNRRGLRGVANRPGQVQLRCSAAANNWHQAHTLIESLELRKNHVDVFKFRRKSYGSFDRREDDASRTVQAFNFLPAPPQ
ncbi:hypothetical protein ACJJTC_012199 [Scirpophaga incertulas]